MVSTVLNEYLERIPAKYYSVIIINSLNEPTIISNMSHIWEVEFIEKKLHLHSEIVLKARDKITPFVWNSDNINNSDIKSLSIKYDIHNGVSFVMKIKNDLIIFTLYFEQSRKDFLAIYDQKKQHILYDIFDIFEKNYQTQNVLTLTRREKEVLDLLKFGKTYYEIGWILEIGERTVRFHINNILDKLDVTSVRYAIFKATSAGII